MTRLAYQESRALRVGGVPILNARDAREHEAAVRRAARLVDVTEYKRRQAPPGIKITPRAFGRDRRLPITNHFKG